MGMGDKILECYLYTFQETKVNNTENCNLVYFHSGDHPVDCMVIMNSLK